MKLKNLITLAVGALLLGLASTSQAGKPEEIADSEMKLIPEYCPDTMGFNYGDAFHNTSPRAGHWVSLMGNNFWHMHHYCWARINMNRAQRSGSSAQQRKALWESARNDYRYVINHSADDFIMLPEVYTRLGEVELLLRRPHKANEAFAHARQLKPDYWPAYSYWAEYLLAKGQRPEALKVVVAGLRQAPNSRVLHELFKVLGGKPSDLPKADEKNKDKEAQDPDAMPGPAPEADPQAPATAGPP